MTWISQLFCAHNWVRKEINKGYYDYESWYECSECKKQKDM